eukprot:1377880-Amorphochlora_amoeboformis.AAC.1
MEIRRESIKYNGQRGGGEATGGLAGHVARVHAGVTQISHHTPCHPQVSPSTVTFLCDRMDRTHRQALGVFLVVFVGILGVGGPWRGRALRGIPEEGGRSSLENTAVRAFPPIGEVLPTMVKICAIPILFCFCLETFFSPLILAPSHGRD